MEDRENGMLQQEDVAPVESGEETEANDIASLTLEDEREFVREMIRKRRQHDWVSRAIFQPAKPKPSIRDEGKKDVAAYTRVSTLSKDQTSSIENQTQYYTEKIEKTPNWNLQKIYTDEGKSGTSMRRREQFKEMLADAADKKMDLILCASVSRFARNVSDCIDQVRLLRTINPSHPVGVYFETENIYTLDPDSDQSLQIHALLADWESANKSRRMILSYDQRICTGQYPVLDLLGLKHTKDGDLVIEPEGAKTCRFIFLALLVGYSAEEVAMILTEKARPTLHGRTEWTPAMVKNILTNERRWGDLQARKTIVIDYKAGKIAKNNNDRDAAFIPNHHQGIVSREIASALKYLLASSRQVTGLSELIVINKGALKGFVSVSPGWSGIDDKTFIYACKRAYSEAEWLQMEKEARLLTGEEHSNVLSMELTGYEVPRGVFFMGRNTPALTMSDRTLSFNKACHERLGNCPYIEVLYHPILQTLIVRSADAESTNAVRWITPEGKPISYISAKAYMGSIYDKMEWIRDYRFKFRGISRERGAAKILFFHLEEPRIIAGQRKGPMQTTNGISESESAIQYIPYKDKHNSEAPQFVGRAYPVEWTDAKIGVSLSLRKHRDALIHTITEEDITEPGLKITNPMIGELPDINAVQEEVKGLLVSL